jgi:hypothetical protein
MLAGCLGDAAKTGVLHSVTSRFSRNKQNWLKILSTGIAAGGFAHEKPPSGWKTAELAR